VSTDYGLLGPLEAVVDGRAAKLGGPKQRAVLALLLADGDTVVPASRLIDELWGDEPPSSAANLVQGYVSGLRKVLGKNAIETRGTGYIAHVGPQGLDLRRFERLAHEGSKALVDGRPAAASDRFLEALALWRGAPLADLADETGLQPLVARLEELRTLARERRLEAELACGRHADVVGEATALAHEHPLRERPCGLLMRALYGSGRQAEALDVYRQARETLVAELGIEPGRWLRDLHASMLRQDASLQEDVAAIPAEREALRSLVVAALDEGALEALLALAEPLSREPAREILVVRAVSDGADLGSAVAQLHSSRSALLERGVEARAAAFTSVTPGADLARVTAEHDVDLLVIDAPDRLLEDARLLTMLERAPCDVAIVVGGSPRPGPVLVAFAGAEHDWSAVEVGAWLARNSGVGLRLAGAATGAEGRDASRLLASASLAVQRAFGVPAEPLLVEPSPEALVAAAADAGVVVAGLTDRWRRDGLGRARTALATRPVGSTVLVRRGVRPGGLAPRESETRFTWTIAAG
jgi:DNA-binding SARP family transcriptional activator